MAYAYWGVNGQYGLFPKDVEIIKYYENDGASIIIFKRAFSDHQSDCYEMHVYYDGIFYTQGDLFFSDRPGPKTQRECP